MKKWGQAPRVGVILAVLLIEWRSQSPFFHKLGGAGRSHRTVRPLGCATASTAEELRYPLSIAVHRSGAVYLADRNLPGVWRIEGERLGLFFRGSKKFRTPLNAIRCVAFDGDGKLLAGDTATRDIYRFDEKDRLNRSRARESLLARSGFPWRLSRTPRATCWSRTLKPTALSRFPRREESAVVRRRSGAPGTFL